MMPPIRVHHTETTTVPWDGGANVARLSNDAGEATYRRVYAWADPAGDPDTKAAYKFPHHEVSADGTPGAANLAACRNIKARVPQADIPSSDDEGVNMHAQAHMDDASEGEMAGAAVGSSWAAGLADGLRPHAYPHVTKALYERPWAVQRAMLTTMAGVVSLRASGGSFAPEEIQERLRAAREEQGPREGAVRAGPVAVIPMYGILSQRMTLLAEFSGGTSLDQMRDALRRSLADPDTKAVVFDIDSPGGATDGLTEFATELRAARGGAVPLIAQVNTLAASAAYWLASQMDEVVVTPSGEVGSIGIFAVHEDLSQAGALAGIKTTLISAGPYKVEGNEFEPLTDEARGAIQEQVDEFYQMFLGDVAKGRQTTPSDVAANYGEGRTLLARKALAAGMVDRIATLEETVRRFQPRAVRTAPATERAALAASTRRADPAWNAAHTAAPSRRLTK